MRLLFLLFCALAPGLAAFAADEHSFAEPERVRVRDIGLDLVVDFERKELRGTADLALDWIDPKARTLVLDTRSLTIEKVLARSGDGGWRRADYTLGPSDATLGTPLRIQLKRQHEIVRVRYRTAPDASGLQWLEPGMTSGKQQPFMFSQSQAIHARSWVPLQDTPGVRFTYSASIRTPSSLMALMSADNDPAASRDGKYVFRMPQPIPSYLLAIAVGDVVFKPISERAGVWAEPSVLDAAVREFDDTERMIVATEALYGPYRWGRYDLLILPPSFPFGGMENPRLSFITPTVIAGDKSLVALIAHELAHSWSGNLVTNASWKDIWLNEGFTSYVENRIVESLYGAEQAAMENVISQNGLRTELAGLAPADQVLALPPLTGRDPDEALSDVAYVKGQWFLIFLEQRFGREVFDAFLRRWFDANAFASVDTAHFVKALREDLLPQQPDAVTEAELDAWLNQPGIPEVAVPASSTRFALVDAARAAFLAGDKGPADLGSDGWITQEWVHFLEGMPETLTPEQLNALDSAFTFTGTGNGEIARVWYPLTVRSGYFEARNAIAAFLKSIGRRKLIMPTYEALVAREDGIGFARTVFAEARPGYHPITIGSIEALLAKAAPADAGTAP